MSYRLLPVALAVATALSVWGALPACAQDKLVPAPKSVPTLKALTSPPQSAPDLFTLDTSRFAISLNSGLGIELMSRYDLRGEMIARQRLLPQAPALIALPYVDSLFAADKAHQAGLTLPFLCLSSVTGMAHLEAVSELEVNGKSASQNFLEQRSNAAIAANAAGIMHSEVPSYDPKAGLAWLQLPKAHLQQGVVNELAALPRNGYKVNLQATALRTLWQNLALYSHVDSQGFKLPASPFDKHIYARFLGRMLNGDSFAALGKGCSLTSEQNCGLYFVGEHVLALLKDSGRHSPFYIEDDLYGIPLRMDENAQPQLVLRAAMGSDFNFVNYANLLELELAVLQDLGYAVNPRVHYGYSVYNFGTKEEPLRQQLNLRYAALDAKGRYTRLPAQAPLGVGLHVYGSYNDLHAAGSILTKGAGAIGVRIDGSNNRLILPYLSLIMVDGPQGAGVVVSNGHDNVLSLEGRVHAPGLEGVGVMASFGDDIYSKLTEAQGSWQRTRAVPSESGPRADKLPLFSAQQGALCSKINVSGQVEGNQAAIFIADNAMVQELNLNGQAMVKGDIIIKWQPQLQHDTAGAPYWQGMAPQLEAGFLGAVLQVPANTPFEQLQTKMHLGLKRSIAAATGESAHVGDPNAQVRINGNIEAPATRVMQIDGRAEIKGNFNVHTLHQYRGLLRLDLPLEGKAQLQELRLDAGAVLDIVNGHGDTLDIGQGFFNRESSIRVDAASDGILLDKLNFIDGTHSNSGYLTLEPAVSFEVLKSLASDPKRFLDFLSNFTNSANAQFKDEEVFIAFPKRIWDNGGTYGREVNCSARGCRIGDFVRSYQEHQPEVATWRYLLSAGGLVLLLALTYLYFSLPWLKLKCHQLLRLFK
ncbi:MAG: hypothetical protein IAA31_04005 [Candidatus Anaerobiospirillum merdipullorum]|uniref:Cellulose synthase regulatory subunit n=1 Tax=Candidatus Anaerobiospirillum merdipullorum TaxID=2838450 RepID=A0A9E2NS04_9GAMM|nr:hypothetical protein [Candidatus Anaerobiospirillum merdipullorum]